jgi:hypothetical protein
VGSERPILGQPSGEINQASGESHETMGAVDQVSKTNGHYEMFSKNILRVYGVLRIGSKNIIFTR